MADLPHTPSGSRWEPDPAGPEPVAASVPTGPAEGPVAAARRAQVRGRAILAGAATALTLGGGVAGFVIGHSTAGGNDLRPANFSGRFGNNPGSQFDGGQPGDGQQGPPAFGGRDGDGDGERGPRQPDTNGSSGSSSSSSSGTGT